jgi:hypothetical protein
MTGLEDNDADNGATTAGLYQNYVNGTNTTLPPSPQGCDVRGDRTRTRALLNTDACSSTDCYAGGRLRRLQAYGNPDSPHMDIEARYSGPNASCRHAKHPGYSYLLRDRTIDQPHQAWAMTTPTFR